ncbi:hypothetical protein NEPAR08_0658 [Nematocida parisii]|nr:hypothetical protein NEPAR03_0659 [Nematocida parisii]KAI5126908.1 hypothetical protein NEPAR08_0658 [Nematocida parisii]
MKIEGKVIDECILKNEIGIGCISSQILKKTLQRGIEFNLFVAAERGLGAKTLISSIYNLTAFPAKVHTHSSDLVEYSAILQSNKITLKLTIFLYQGKDHEYIKNFLVERNTIYNKNNIGLRRERKEAPRMHAALFLISPFSFKKEDIQIIQVLSELTNTFPIIPKRDIFTVHELEAYQEKISTQLKMQGIKVSDLIPEGISVLSVVASTTFVSVNGELVRGREYAWGIINAENPAVSDLNILTQLLLTVNLIDLKNNTAQFYQEWKKSAPELSDPCLEEADKELVKEIECIIAGNLKERLGLLEKQEKEIDQKVRLLDGPAFKSLNV